MSDSTITNGVTQVVDEFERGDGDAERIRRYQRAIERFDELKRRGLAKESGYDLLPIEKMHRPSPLLSSRRH